MLGLDVDESAVEVALANAAANGVALIVRNSDALSEPLPEMAVALANVALDVVEALLPRLPARRAVVSGYLDRDEPRAAGWRHRDRREMDGWAADLFERN